MWIFTWPSNSLPMGLLFKGLLSFGLDRGSLKSVFFSLAKASHYTVCLAMKGDSCVLPKPPLPLVSTSFNSAYFLLKHLVCVYVLIWRGVNSLPPFNFATAAAFSRYWLNSAISSYKRKLLHWIWLRCKWTEGERTWPEEREGRRKDVTRSEKGRLGQG